MIYKYIDISNTNSMILAWNEAYVRDKRYEIGNRQKNFVAQQVLFSKE